MVSVEPPEPLDASGTPVRRFDAGSIGTPGRDHRGRQPVARRTVSAPDEPNPIPMVVRVQITVALHLTPDGRVSGTIAGARADTRDGDLGRRPGGHRGGGADNGYARTRARS